MGQSAMDAPPKAFLTPLKYPPHLANKESTMSNRYYIPNNLENWKWPRHLNPHYPEAKAASAAWARSFGAFSPKAQYAYDRCDFSTSYHVLYNPTLSLTSGQTSLPLLPILCLVRVRTSPTPRQRALLIVNL
jgi:hypothetical protein